MFAKTSLFLSTVAALVAVTLAEVPVAAGDDTTPPAVPSNLEVQDGSQPFLIGHAVGTQNYSCLPSGKGYAWTLYGPQATLFNDAAEQLMTHFLSPNPIEGGVPRPTWQDSRDTSSAWGAAVATSTDPNYVAPGAIPWLLLRVVGTQSGPLPNSDRLVGTTFIQRVNTAGGVAPSTGCSKAGDVGKKALVAYSTDYVFYR